MQTAATLPMVLFALVAGVLSDAFDRRRLMLWVQVYFVVVAGLLAVLTAVGPAIAGLLIAAWGVPPVFAFNAACTLFLIGALLSWRREPVTAPVARERFLPALRAGGRYVRHEPVVRLILLRLAVFVAPATAMRALLLPPSTSSRGRYLACTRLTVDLSTVIGSQGHTQGQYS